MLGLSFITAHYCYGVFVMEILFIKYHHSLLFPRQTASQELTRPDVERKIKNSKEQ